LRVCLNLICKSWLGCSEREIVTRKTSSVSKSEECDPEQLHAMDETNEEWVAAWKKAAKPKKHS
jgi:hypothetical protein